MDETGVKYFFCFGAGELSRAGKWLPGHATPFISCGEAAIWLTNIGLHVTMAGLRKFGFFCRIRQLGAAAFGVRA
jgi:hypothetical protein